MDIAGFLEIAQPPNILCPHPPRLLQPDTLDVDPVRIAKHPHRHTDLEILVAGDVGLDTADAGDNVREQQKEDRCGNDKSETLPEGPGRGVR